MLMNKVDIGGTRYRHFFLPEIKKFIDLETFNAIKNEILEIDPTITENFIEKRQKGVNDSYICSLIRDDLIGEFIEYMTRNNISLNSSVKHSIFETNVFLIENTPPLIEYASFYGSIQIFQYLLYNNVEINPSLWLYAIQSHKPRLIHIIEENEINPEDGLFEGCLLESIKCHWKSFTNYILNNKLNSNNYSTHFKEDVISYSFRYYNYMYFPNDFNNDDNYNLVFFYSCLCNYSKVVFCFLEMKKNNIKNFINIII